MEDTKNINESTYLKTCRRIFADIFNFIFPPLQTMRVTDWSGFVDFVDRVRPARLDLRRLPYVKVLNQIDHSLSFKKLQKIKISKERFVTFPFPLAQTPDETWEEIATAVAPRMGSVTRLEFPRISCAVMNKVIAERMRCDTKLAVISCSKIGSSSPQPFVL